MSQSKLFLSFFLSLGFIVLVFSQTEEGPKAMFGRVIPISGAMQRFDQDFTDGFGLDLLSPSNRSVLVTLNAKPLSPQFVTGSNGGPWIALQDYSYVVKTSDAAGDLIAKIEVPYNPFMLNNLGIQEANTYVARLADDKMSWEVDENRRNVHRSENVTRIIKMTNIDGEFRLLGRQTEDASNILLQYGQGPTRTFNITGGGRQETEFVDGMRFSVISSKDLAMNVDIKFGIAPQTLPAGMQSLNPYSWIVNTSDQTANLTASIKIPFNRDVLSAKTTPGSTAVVLGVARRPLSSPSIANFAAVTKMMTYSNKDTSDGKLSISGLSSLDGEYTIFIGPAK